MSVVTEDEWTPDEMDEAADLLERALAVIASPERWTSCQMAEMADRHRSIREADRFSFQGAIAAAAPRDMPLDNWCDGHILYDVNFVDGRAMAIADDAIPLLTLGRCKTVEDIDTFVFKEGSPPFERTRTHGEAHERLGEIVVMLIEELRDAALRKRAHS